MVDLDGLREEAEKVSRGRGHSLRWMQPWVKDYRSVQRAECDRDGCPASVEIDTHPVPDGPGIRGDAVGLDCPVPRKVPMTDEQHDEHLHFLVFQGSYLASKLYRTLVNRPPSNWRGLPPSVVAVLREIHESPQMRELVDTIDAPQGDNRDA